MLHVFMLGGRHRGARIEVHDVAFADVDNVQDAYPLLRNEWFGEPNGLHIDGWLAVDGVDEYKVGFSDHAPAPGSPRLYFVNLGGYTPGSLGEAHDYLLLVAESLGEARLKAKAHRPTSWFKPHTDAVMDVDECIAIDQLGGRFVQLTRSEHAGITLKSDYIVIGA
jgi:hypothetical protein